MNGRPACCKNNKYALLPPRPLSKSPLSAAPPKLRSTNHMLWFAMATDPATERQAPTWYVGKAKEFGQARGWLQVRSDAERPSEIRNSWSVWSTVEKVWKEAPDVKCIAVSATAGVVIKGPTPNNLLQDKLGEYRRVQLRVITERGVYEMVGMPNVMMWYAPGGTWNIGKRDELGQNRGWYQAVSKAISPEGSRTGRCGTARTRSGRRRPSCRR